LATRRAATTFAPDEVPANSPSSQASRRAILMASSADTCEAGQIADDGVLVVELVAPTGSGLGSRGRA